MVFTIVAGLAIVARLLTRTLVSKQFGLDDVLITVSGVSHYEYATVSHMLTISTRSSASGSAQRRMCKRRGAWESMSYVH